MRLFKPAATLVLTLSLVGTSTPAPAVSTNQLIDMTIQAVDPDLQKVRPILQCAVGGSPMKTCISNATLGQGVALTQSMEAELYYAEHVYDMANSGDITGLVASLGVHATCTVFGQVAAGNVLCNKFAVKLVDAATELGKGAKTIGMEVGSKVVQSLTDLGTGISCATRVYCPDEDKDDPNKFNYHFAGGKLSIPKFDLEAMWVQDYAPRLGEGVRSRLTDNAVLLRMIAVPPHRAIAMLKPGGKSLYFSADALGAATINARVNALLAVSQGGVPAGLLDVNAAAFEPFERQLNARWLQEVNRTAAQLLEPEAQKFLTGSSVWRQQQLPAISLAQFWPGKIQPAGTQMAALDDCVSRIENPARVLWRWADGGAAAQDSSQLAGQGASYWRTASRNFCRRSLEAALAGRKQSYDAAISHGCKPRTDGIRGLDCPASSTAKPGYAPYKVGSDGEQTGGPAKGQVGVVPVELCREAFAPSGGQFCRVPDAAPRLRVPLRTILPAPQPSPSPTTTPIRPRVLIPGG